MNIAPPDTEPSSAQLLAVINAQTEVAKLGLDLNGVMALVAERSQVITRATGAIIELVEGDEMVYRAVAGVASRLLGLRLARNTSLSGLCVASATTLRCDDSETDARVDREACRRVGLRSMIVVPLFHNGAAVGVLKVCSPLPSAFGEGDVQILGLMSELIAASMFHAARYGTDELYRRATRDNLTGLANRAFFYDRLRHSLSAAKREGRRVGVLMLDMDGLKPINDTHGHRAGDAAIMEIASRVSADVREVDTVARLGGDEFAVILSTVEDSDGALAAGLRITARCARPFTFENRPLKIGASLGVAIYPEDGEEPDELVEKADQSMYVAKRRKKRDGRESAEVMLHASGA
jgi:diguanylate cyclase (GGDEF)-like protein